MGCKTTSLYSLLYLYMCGFVGVVSSTTAPDINKIKAANLSQNHRGPDDGGTAFGDWWGLGFRRLAILDLAATGHQPMQTEDGKVTLVFNGEIYNFLALKRQLQAEGYTFNGSGDTEVLLALYLRCNGNVGDMLEQCNGMFAFALIDQKRRRLVFARDRLGVKPFRFARTANGIVFSSEIKGLLKLLPEQPAISTEALFAYLRLGFIPSWLSIYEGIENLRPGHWGEWLLNSNQTKISQYWIPGSGRISETRTENEWIESSEELLEEATRIRLKADVPVGIFLSGGIDSGLVAAKVKQFGNSKIVAHHIRFPQWENDESVLAKKTASHLGIQLQIHDAEVPDMSELASIISHFDEPFSDSSAIVTDLVCSKASLESTVIISGDGGDESFAGYSEYSRTLKWGWLDSMPNFPLNVIGKLLSSSHNGKISRIGERLHLSKNVRSAWSHIFPCDKTLEQISSPVEGACGLFNPESITEYISVKEHPHPLDRAQICDMSLYMVDNVLTKVDMISMRNSLEVRSPFLDYRLVELALSIPPKTRMKLNRSKHILRQIADKILPKEVTHARKRGFGVPLQSYMFSGGKVKAEVKERLYSLTVDDWFEPSLMDKYLSKIDANSTIDATHLYRLFCLALWKNK